MNTLAYSRHLGLIAVIILVIGGLFGSVALREQRNSTEILHHVDSLINENPDSASALIGKVNPNSLSSDASRALYALLQVRLATIYNTVPSDSALSTAIGYYKNRLGERGRYVQALVCRGLKQRRLGDVKGATITLRTARDKADANDYLDRGITEFCLAQLYQENYGVSPNRVADRYMSALVNYNKAGSRRFALVAISACARAYRQSNTPLADSCLEHAITLARESGNKHLYYGNLEYKARIMAQRGEYAQALRTARLCLAQGKGHTGNDTRYALAIAYAGLGKRDSALIWARSAKRSSLDPYDDVTRFSTLSQIASIQNDTTLARLWSDSCRMVTDSLADNPQMRTIKYAEGEYDATSHNYARRRTMWLWSTGLAAIAAGLIVTAVIIMRRRRLDRDMELFKRSLNKRK